MRRAAALGAIVLRSLAACGGGWDPGGDVVAAGKAVLEARRQGSPVAIRGVCFSACALKLGAGAGLCVSPNAAIGVHEVRRAPRPSDYQSGARDNLATGFFEGLLPRCADDLFAARRGFDSGRLTVVSGRDILAACPQMRPCAE